MGRSEPTREMQETQSALSALCIHLGGDAVLPSMGGRKMAAGREEGQGCSPRMSHAHVYDWHVTSAQTLGFQRGEPKPTPECHINQFATS